MWTATKKLVRALFVASLVLTLHAGVLAVCRVDWDSAKSLGGYLILSGCIFPNTLITTIQKTALFYYRILSILWVVGLWFSFVALGVSLVHAGFANDYGASDGVYTSLKAILILLVSTPVLRFLGEVAGLNADPTAGREQKLPETPPDFEGELKNDYRRRKKARR